MKYVIKRNGETQEFDENKIKKALSKAFTSVGKVLSDIDWVNIFSQIRIKKTINIEDLQDQIETALMIYNYFDVAKAYIIYREKHREIRFIKERSDYIEKCSKSTSNTATLSEVDENANVQVKNVATIEAETYKSLNKNIQRYKMKKKLKELFPEVADQYERDLESHIIYAHDEASSPVPKPYCVAVSLYPFLLNGTSTLDGLRSKAPTNLSSFCGQFNNLVFLLSSQYRGAVAFGEFFNVFYYYCVKEWGEEFWKQESFTHDPNAVKPKTISEYIEQCFQNIVYSINQSASNRSFQSPFTNISYYDKGYWTALFKDFYFPDGSQPNWSGVDYLQKKFMRWFNGERSRTLLTFPVETMALLTNGNEIIDKDYEEFTCEMYSKGHSFFTYLSDNPDALASCCRLRNEIDKNEFNFTSGLTGVATGSVNVITLNLNRIGQEFDRTRREALCPHGYEIEFKEYLIDIIQRVHKYQTAFKEMLYELYDNNMLPVYTAGYIDLKQQFSTIGINGLNELAEYYGIKCNDNPDYLELVETICSTISEQNRLAKTNRIKFNLEFVPAEGLGIKNYNWDKEDGYKVPSNANCYNSYLFRPEDNTINVFDKLILHGRKYTDKMDGGMGCHINMGEHLTKEQYKQVIGFAVKEGTSYFTFNIPNSECTNCGHIEKRPLKECPKCGSNKITWWTRIIGYLRPVSAFSEGRQEEAKRRYYSYNPEYKVNYA